MTTSYWETIPAELVNNVESLKLRIAEKINKEIADRISLAVR